MGVSMLTWFYRALRERIASEVAGTNAHGSVADHTTLGVDSARALARIPAFLIYTRQVEGTLAVANTLRPTVGR